MGKYKNNIELSWRNPMNLTRLFHRCPIDLVYRQTGSIIEKQASFFSHNICPTIRCRLQTYQCIVTTTTNGSTRELSYCRRPDDAGWNLQRNVVRNREKLHARFSTFLRFGEITYEAKRISNKKHVLSNNWAVMFFQLHKRRAGFNFWGGST